MAEDDSLGAYLKARRARLDPAALGFAVARRRTPGLRREEVAGRAGVSTTWYTWLEQGRGGAPSADALDRIAHALMLTDVEREHLFLLGLGRLPDVRFRAPDGISPRLQRVLDAFEASPALVRTATWDIVAWNRAARAVLTDYEAIPAAERNVLRLMFGDTGVRSAQADWEATARFVVATFRAETTRAGASEAIRPLVEDLARRSPEFAAMWADHDVLGHGEGVKRLVRSGVGRVDLEYSAFVVDGRPDLGMVVYNPATAEAEARIRTLLATWRPAQRPAEVPAA